MKSRKKFSLLDANDDDLITFGEWEWGTLLRQWGLNLTTGMDGLGYSSYETSARNLPSFLQKYRDSYRVAHLVC